MFHLKLDAWPPCASYFNDPTHHQIKGQPAEQLTDALKEDDLEAKNQNFKFIALKVWIWSNMMHLVRLSAIFLLLNLLNLADWWDSAVLLDSSNISCWLGKTHTALVHFRISPLGGTNEQVSNDKRAKSITADAINFSRCDINTAFPLNNTCIYPDI